jgi:hypothetical protein
VNKAYNFEKHRKRIRKKAYLNLLLIFLVAGGIGFALSGPIAAVLASTPLGNPFLAIGILMGAVWLLVWSIPLLHFKEEIQISYTGEFEDVKGVSEDFPTVQVLVEQGWEISDSGEEYIELEVYPSSLHRALGRKTTMRIELLESDESDETLMISVDGKEREKVEAEYSREDGKVLITEEGVSMHRLSLSYLEPVMFMMPEIRDMIQEADQDMKIEDMNMELSWKTYDS